LGLQLLWWL